MVDKLTKKSQAEFQTLLTNQAEKTKQEIEVLKKDDPFSDPDHASDNAAVDTDVREQVGHDTIEAQIKDLQKKLNDIELALKKMTRGKYGVCERCGVNIPLARLKILPEARYCVDCESKVRK